MHTRRDSEAGRTARRPGGCIVQVAGKQTPDLRAMTTTSSPAPAPMCRLPDPHSGPPEPEEDREGRRPPVSSQELKCPSCWCKQRLKSSDTFSQAACLKALFWECCLSSRGMESKEDKGQKPRQWGSGIKHLLRRPYLCSFPGSFCLGRFPTPCYQAGSKSGPGASGFGFPLFLRPQCTAPSSWENLWAELAGRLTGAKWVRMQPFLFSKSLEYSGSSINKNQNRGREEDARRKIYGNICICITDSLCYKAETNTPL